MRAMCAALMLAACAKVHVSPYAPELYRVGRFDDADPNGPRFTWSASRFSVRFFGESVRIAFQQTTRPPSAEAGPQALRLRVDLDGTPHDVFAGEDGSLEFH